jgi:hypothetical protein
LLLGMNQQDSDAGLNRVLNKPQQGSPFFIPIMEQGSDMARTVRG